MRRAHSCIGDRDVQRRLGECMEEKLRRRVASECDWTSNSVCLKCLLSLNKQVKAGPGVDQTQKFTALGEQ